MAKQAKKSRKHGRNSKWCQAYRATGRREINRAKKLYRLIARSPLVQYIAAFEQLSSSVRERARKELKQAGALYIDRATNNIVTHKMTGGSNATQ